MPKPDFLQSISFTAVEQHRFLPQRIWYIPFALRTDAQQTKLGPDPEAAHFRLPLGFEAASLGSHYDFGQFVLSLEEYLHDVLELFQ